jgi:ketosteroid isomerase-like protein
MKNRTFGTHPHAHSRGDETPVTGRRLFLCLSLFLMLATVLGVFPATGMHRVSPSKEDDREAVAVLDSEYQAAVKRNDAATMTRILADDFVLVTGSGKTYTKADMLEDARKGDIYEKNDEDVQIVRVWGDTAVVTAKLSEKFTSNGKSYDHKFWFSDTYVRTPTGWKYVFGQSSLPLPNSAQ